MNKYVNNAVDLRLVAIFTVLTYFQLYYYIVINVYCLFMLLPISLLNKDV